LTLFNNSWQYWLPALAAQLAAALQALSEEKNTRSTIVKALAEAQQTLKYSDAEKAKLSQALKTTQAIYIVTQDNLASKSKELDDVVIWEQEDNTLWELAEAKLANLEKKIKAVEGKKKDQGLLLETAQQVLSKREDSSSLMISTAVANAMSLLKSHLPDLDVKLLRKDFAVDEADRESLISGTYDATHEFLSSYDFSSLAEYKDNDSPRNM
jgi:chromosome segregation ATPase